MTVFIIVSLIVLGLVLYNKFFKIPKLNNVVLVTGGVKSGKSTMSVHFALRKYRRALIGYHIKSFFLRIFGKKGKIIEKPLLYSNVPLKCDFVPLTEDLILRKKRFAYGSVIYIQEASLLADSMDYKDEKKNDALRLFNKLIAHETLGGTIIYDTQAVSDCHFSIKRCLSSYFYIHHSIKLPFFVVCYVREMIYSDDEGVMNVFNDDVEFGLRRVIIPKRVWKKFDCYTYSALTDHLPVVDEVVEGEKLEHLKSYTYLHLKNEKKESVKNNGKKA